MVTSCYLVQYELKTSVYVDTLSKVFDTKQGLLEFLSSQLSDDDVSIKHIVAIDLLDTDIKKKKMVITNEGKLDVVNDDV